MTETAEPRTDDVPPYRYNARLAGEIEQKWQDRWEDERTFWAPNPPRCTSGPTVCTVERTRSSAARPAAVEASGVAYTSTTAAPGCCHCGEAGATAPCTPGTSAAGTSSMVIGPRRGHSGVG